MRGKASASMHKVFGQAGGRSPIEVHEVHEAHSRMYARCAQMKFEMNASMSYGQDGSNPHAFAS